MRGKIVVIVIIGMFLLTGFFGNASAIKNTEISDENSLEYLRPAPLLEEEEVYAWGRYFSWGEGDITYYGSFAVRLSSGDNSAYVGYDFYLGYTKVEEGMKIGIYFCDWAAYPWAGGPDLSVYNWEDDEWTNWSNVGNHDNLQWVWKCPSDSNKYVNNEGVVSIKVFAETDDDTILEMVGVKFIPVEPEPDLKCDGKIKGGEVGIGKLVSSTFTVMNIGEEGSLLDWKVESWPPWGSGWNFYPSSGNDLPAGSSKTVTVEFYAPGLAKDWSGTILVVNMEDMWDYDTVDVSVTTTKKSRDRPLFFQSLERLLDRFLLLERLLNLRYNKIETISEPTSTGNPVYIGEMHISGNGNKETAIVRSTSEQSLKIGVDRGGSDVELKAKYSMSCRGWNDHGYVDLWVRGADSKYADTGEYAEGYLYTVVPDCNRGDTIEWLLTTTYYYVLFLPPILSVDGGSGICNLPLSYNRASQIPSNQVIAKGTIVCK